MKEQFIRTAMLLGEESIKKLNESRVAVFGLGGVGGHAAEALVRSGIGTVDLIDSDVVSISNINRQVVADYETVGRLKTEVMKERIARINPECRVNVYQCFYLPEYSERISFSEYDFILDAVDTVTAKVDLAFQAQEHGIPFISCMGTGNKLDPQKLRIADLYATSGCPLAKVMRKECRSRNISGFPVVFSEEPARTPMISEEWESVEKPEGRRQVSGSVAFVPAVAGLMMAGYVVRKISGEPF